MVDEIRYNLFKKRYNLLFYYGVMHGLIKKYDDELLNNLSHIYLGGLKATILLLHLNLANGHCYDRATLVTLGFQDDDFQVVDSLVDGLRLRPDLIKKFKEGNLSENYGGHCFAERKDKDGKIWVYDTSVGLVFEKNLYYRMQHPIIKKVNNREKTLAFLEELLKDSNFEEDKYMLPLILPPLETNLVPTQPFYLEQLKKEISLLKEEIGYEDICQEIKKDMQRKGFF